MFNARSKRQAVQQVGSWWHSIDVGDGVVTPGYKTPQMLAAELDAIAMPADLTGKTVLDVGGLDGFYSFEAERRGAERVVIVDYPNWLGARYDHPELRPAADELAQLDSDQLPGRRGFELAHRLRESRVEPQVVDLATDQLERLGRFDVVFLLGVLYHLEDPLHGLRQVAAVTSEMAIVETEAVVVPGFEHEALWRFFAADELNNDASNWWAPNLSGLGGALQAAGFDRVEAKVGPAPDLLDREGGPHHYRAIVHAFK